MKRIIILSLVCIFLLNVQARAEITPSLLYEWSKQPSNVQWNVYHQNTAINVVDTLPWESPSLADTYAYTTMNVIPNTMYVQSINMYVKRGHESALTHEVGHCISNAGHSVYWWCYRPEFIQIWQQERYKNIMMAQGFDDSREYFACAYDMYINYPQILKQANPMTYNYITVVLQYT